MTYKKKLIEVTLPLEVINQAASSEKSIRQGHPVMLHLWWARRPLAAASAVLFSSIIDDPSNYLTEKEAAKERKRLFKIISDHIQWKNYSNKKIIERTRQEVAKAVGKSKPVVYDPFSGGGSIALEAQRLGLKAYASDLNPVAVIISKSLVEILPKFHNLRPINGSPKLSKMASEGKNSVGFSEDFRYYSEWVLKEADKQLKELYPLTKSGKTIIAWLWARTVKCQNPACSGTTPLLRSYVIKKQGKKNIWFEPIIDQLNKTFTFKIHNDTVKPPKSLKVARGANFNCIFCGLPMDQKYVRKEGKSRRMHYVLLGGVIEGTGGQEYVDSSELKVPIAKNGDLGNLETELSPGARCPAYGLERYCDLFTERQLKSLITLTEFVKSSKKKIISDGTLAGIPDDGVGLSKGGTKLTAYAEAIITFIAFVVDRCVNYWSTLTPWGGGFIVQTYSRQRLSMVWDFAEANPFSNSTGSYMNSVEHISKVIDNCTCDVSGQVEQLDAASANLVQGAIVCTDPPYYDNIGYADNSDYFYVWLRRMLSDVYPDIFSTMLVPKKQEIVASANRFGGDEKAKKHFTDRLSAAFRLIRESMNDQYPFTLFYAFKQTEDSKDTEIKSPHSTGWETMLQSLIDSGFHITGTWSMRTERATGLKKVENSLASSIVIVCRPRQSDAPLGTRRELISELKKELPHALKNLQEAIIAPVDMAQAAIGPGMGVFTKYSKVLEADGSPMSVKTALQIINQELDAYLVAQEADMDRETRFCISWYEQFGWSDGSFGEANTLATAKGTAINTLEALGLVRAKTGRVRLVGRKEFPKEWDPLSGSKVPIWGCIQYLVKTLEDKGELAAADIIKKLGGLTDSVKELAYRLYSLAEKKGWAEDALRYNMLISSWQAITDKAQFAEFVSQEDKKTFKNKSQKTLDSLG